MVDEFVQIEISHSFFKFGSTYTLITFMRTHQWVAVRPSQGWFVLGLLMDLCEILVPLLRLSLALQPLCTDLFSFY